MSLELKTCLWALTLVVFAPGCVPRVAMVPQTIQQDGRAVFAGTPEKVMQAVQEALDALNIGVAVAKPETGLVISKRFTLASYAQGGRYVATVNEDTVQYDITVKAVPEGVEVVCSPRGFHNNQEVTEMKVWQLDGPYGQRPRWQKLFGEIRRMLGA